VRDGRIKGHHYCSKSSMNAGVWAFPRTMHIEVFPMSLHESEKRRAKQRKTPLYLQPQSLLREQHQPVIVYPFRQWCAMRGVSISTGRRLAAAGKIRLTRLSERVLGVRSDDDLAYLNSCQERVTT
jgi:hypothetical protein